jgi:hypothetical protein
MYRKSGERLLTATQQISVGGCLTSWDEEFYPGDEFRLELELPNGNRLPLTCRVVYCFDESGIGAKFVDITKFEQSLIAKTITARLEMDGLPMPIDAFETPPNFDDVEVALKVPTERQKFEDKLEEIMALDFDDSGRMSFLKPRVWASRARVWAWRTPRISPVKPTSPKTAVSGGTCKFRKLDAIAATTPRSAAGSSISIPPAMLM